MGFNPILLDFERPYVHSSLTTLSSSVRHSFANVNSEEGEKRIEAKINELIKIRDVLKDEAESFLQGRNPRKVFSEQIGEKQLWEYGRDILNTRKATEIMLDNSYSKTVLESIPLLKNKGRYFQDEIISEADVVKIVSEILIKKFKRLKQNSAKAQKEILIKGFNLSADISKEMSELVKGKMSSLDGKIKDAVRLALREVPLANGSPGKRLAKYFREEMYKRINEDKPNSPIYQQERVEEYIKRVEHKLKTFDFERDQPNIIGQKGEGLFQIVVESDIPTGDGNGFNAKLTLIGDLHEDQLMENFSDIIIGEMHTHHGSNKKSQTDFLLTNSEGKTVRVQSKNMETAYLALLNNNPFPGFAKIQEDFLYKTLIENIKKADVSHLTDEEYGMLSYLIANEIWFRIKKESMNYIGKEVRGISNTTGTINYISAVINKILVSEITNFIGIDIDNSINVKTIKKASRSNVFYLLSNKALLPVYCVIDDLIRMLRQQQEEFAKISVSFWLKGIPDLPPAKKFYKSKLDAVKQFDSSARFDSSKNYSDTALVNVGKETGELIINAAKIRKIGIKFNLKKLINDSLTTSWQI